ncbi:uncharacterized protein LOC120352161 [Nilaparvata lugens]|uniref:uncharacterized protein LOC120352161 n=1 Tax=Nilaparvata lugens TaxID=108931 RepID=UPI00193EA29A|nr:uncharacterized protein LOC120352161 [Nilaparvata lugens]
MKRFHSLEKRFLKEPELKPQYVEFMQEYEDLGHMHPVPPPAPEVTKEFWQQWSEEYLVTLQKRHKWSSSSPNLQVGTLVLLKDPGTPPTLWKLGRITEVFPGSDDKVRVIQVLTDSGVFKHSIASVAPLPLDDSE